MFRQVIRKSTLAPARIQTRTLHSPFMVLSGANVRPSSESKAPMSEKCEPAQSPEKKEPDVSLEPADQSNPRVYVVSHPDPALGAPFGVQLGAYPVSEPFVQ